MQMPFSRIRTVFARRPLVVGVLLGMSLLLALRACVNQTLVVDRLVRPLERPDTQGRADVIVVLGAGVTQLCTPNQHGTQRVLLAAQLYHEGRAPMMLISGGRPGGSPCTVATAMRQLAIRLGVPADRIRVETSSTSTWENALRSDAVLSVLGARRILLVTDRVHSRRAEACFLRFGYEVERASVPVQLGHADNMALLQMGLREAAALAYYVARGFVSSRPETRAKVAAVERPGTVRSPVGGDRREGPVVILGASYAKGWNPPSDAALSFVNRGVEGQQSFELLQRFDADVTALQPRAVILWGFINDVFRSPRPTLDEALARARESYLTMVDLSRERGVTPIIATEVTMGQRPGPLEAAQALVGRLLGRQSYMDYVNRHVLDTNQWLREVAFTRGLLLLDLEAALSNGNGQRRRAYTAADGSHITAEGYEALTQYALPLLRDHLARPSPPMSER